MINILKRFQSFLTGKIEKRKLKIQYRGELQEQMKKDHAEFILMSEKKSKLPKRQRDLVKARIEAYISLGYMEVVKDQKAKENGREKTNI